METVESGLPINFRPHTLRGHLMRLDADSNNFEALKLYLSCTGKKP